MEEVNKSNIPQETPPGEPTSPDTQISEPVSSTQDQIKELVEKYFPGSDMSSQESIDASVLNLLQNLDRVQTKLMVAVENDPAFGAALSETMQGGKFRVAAARAYGPDAFQAVEGDPDYDEMTQGYQEGYTKLQEKQKYAKTIAKNQEMSMKEIEAWMNEKGYGEEEIKARLAKFDEIRRDFLDDKLTKNHLNLIDKAMDYDKDVANAEEAGAVRERNSKIVEKRERSKTASDGLPQLTSAGQKPKPARPVSLLQQLSEEE